MQRCTGCRCLPDAGTLRGVTGTVTLLTGASAGIGRSLARRLAADGHPIALISRRKALLESLVVEIEQAGGRALALLRRSAYFTDALENQQAFEARDIALLAEQQPDAHTDSVA